MKAVKRTENEFFTPEQKKVLAAELKGAPELELERYFITCERTGLDPFSRQIYGRVQSVKTRRPGSKNTDSDDKKWDWNKKIVIITSIDGLRSIAERTGEYRGQTAPEWYYLPVGSNAPGWYDVCPIMRGKGGDPLTTIEACRIGVKRKDFDAPVFGVANFDSFAVYEKGSDDKYYLGTFWKKMPEHMIAKVAEAQAMRKAFPVLTQGVYIAEEIRDDEDEFVQPPSRQVADAAPLPPDMKYVEGHGPNITAASAAAASKPKDVDVPKPKAEPKPAPVKQETTAGDDQSPFGDTDEPKAPEKPAPEPVKPKAAAWQSHVIEHISVAKYHKKTLGQLPPDDIAKLKSSWVDKFADKIKANPSKQAEADMIVAAYEATK